MKKLDVNLKVLLAIIVLLGLSLSILAQPQQRQREYHQRDRSGLGMLNLTDEQKAELKEIHLAQMKLVQPMKDEISINKAKINAQIHKDNPDMKEITSLVEANGKILTEIQVNSIESKIKMRALLTDEQKVMFDSKSMTRHRAQSGKKGKSRL